MTVFDEQPPIINKKKLIFWLKTNYSFLSCKTIKLNELNSERDKNYLIKLNRNKQYIVKISNELEVNLIGLNYKDKESSAKKFINDYGNPYNAILVDNDGTNSIELGAYGVPETFIINNKNKHIIKKYIGPLNKISFNEIKQIIKNEIN